ncbi:Uncharacterized protein APZ42_032120, partial [Daphnia magna]
MEHDLIGGKSYCTFWVYKTGHRWPFTRSSINKSSGMLFQEYQLFDKSTESNMKLFVIAAVLAVAAAAPSSYVTPGYAPSSYVTPGYAPSSYGSSGYKDNKYGGITITSQSDERNLDGSSKWSYAGSDYTTREESQV